MQNSELQLRPICRGQCDGPEVLEERVDTFRPQRLFLGHCPIDFIMDILLLHTTRQYRVSWQVWHTRGEKEGKRHRLTHRLIYDYKNSSSLIFKTTLLGSQVKDNTDAGVQLVLEWRRLPFTATSTAHILLYFFSIWIWYSLKADIKYYM